MNRQEKVFRNAARVLGLGSQVEELLKARGVVEEDQAPVFHDYEQMVNAKPVRFLIKDFLQADGITLLGALAGHSKTWVMVAMVKSLLTGEPLFDYFEVMEKATRVVYLLPEASIGPAFKRFCTNFKLDEYIKNRSLLIATLSSPRKITLNDPEILNACPEADLFLDTLPRFRPEGAKESDADGNKELAEQLFNLQGAQKVRSITAAQHSPKAFEKETYMSLENVIRGSGDIGAMAATAWGLRRLTAATDGINNLVYVENVKPRDFAPPDPFVIRLRPDIDTRGSIGMAKRPGECTSLSEELKSIQNPDKEACARRIWARNPKMGRDRINDLLKREIGAGLSNNALAEMIKRWQVEEQPELKRDDGTPF